MSFTLSELVQAVYADLGYWMVSTATDGGNDTLTDSTLAGVGAEDEWKGGTLVVIEADGAAPEGQFKRIDGYTAVSGQFTAAENWETANPEAGDIYAAAGSEVPLRTMIALVNAGLRGLGEIPLVDTATLQTAAGQSEYSAQAAWKRQPPYRLDVQGQAGDADDNQWRRLYDWEYVPSAPGDSGLIVIREAVEVGRALRVWYAAPHPQLSVYDDEVAELIAPDLAVAAGVERALRWLNGQRGGGDGYLLERWNDAKVELARLREIYPVWRPRPRGRLRMAGIGGSA